MTRDEILDAAAQIFREKGFHAASMQDIADAVKIQKGSLYYHISSKQEILLALLDQALDLLIERIEAVLCRPLPPDEKLRQCIRVYLEAMLEHIDLSAVLFLEHRSLEPQYHARHIPRRDRFERLWRDVLLEGQAQGFFTFDDPALVTRFVLGVLNWTITWYRPDGSLAPAEIAEECSDLFLQGLLVRQGGS